MVFGYLIMISIDIYDFISLFGLQIEFLERKYVKHSRLFHRLSKHLEFRKKYPAARRIFNSVLGVWISQ